MTQLNKQIDELANRAIRVLAIATTEDALGEDALPDSSNWTLVGVVGIRDEVRPESVTAIAEVKGAGVQVVMITGDRKETASCHREGRWSAREGHRCCPDLRRACKALR